MAQDINDLGRDRLIISEIEILNNRIVTRINQQHQENQNDRNTGLLQDLTVLPSNILEWPRWLERSYQEAPEMQVRVEILRMRLLGLSTLKMKSVLRSVQKQIWSKNRRTRRVKMRLRQRLKTGTQDRKCRRRAKPGR